MIKITTEISLAQYLKDLLEKKNIRLVETIGTYRGSEDVTPSDEDLEEVASSLCRAFLDHLRREGSDPPWIRGR